MTATHLEQEVTFEGAGPLDAGRLDALPKVAQVTEAPREELDAVYYDTADLRLLSRGITLRRRRGGHDEGWHLKLPASAGRREVHAPLRAGKPGEVPWELDRRVRAYTRSHRLGPVAHLRTHRRRHLLLDRKGRTLAEVAEDEVDAHILDVERLRTAAMHFAGPEPADSRAGATRRTDARDTAPRGSGADGSGTSTRVVHWSEVEVEKERGDERLLGAADRWLDAHGWSRPARTGKLDHALGAALSLPPDAAPPSRPRPGTAGECFMRRLSEQTDILLETDAAVRADEPDAVHRMRTTSRRLRNLLRDNRPLLDRRRTDAVAVALRRLTRALADARDHEVLAADLPRQAAQLTEPQERALAGRIAGQEAARYAEAHRSAAAWLDRPAYFALLDALDGLRTEPPLRPGRSRRPAAKHLRKVAARNHRRLSRRMRTAADAPAGPPRDKALHQTRKAVRRARHSAETALPYSGKRANKYRKRAKALQGVLGAHQDAVVARAELPDLAARARRRGADTYGYGRLHAEQERRAAAALDALPSMWRRLRPY
ncbi:CYTH and CHAD domain-containing protein [Actinacidiphila yanglinensis]|nr:CYTH and CHAD domain-containing protein [Actinacidiphila yanglinensis]